MTLKGERLKLKGEILFRIIEIMNLNFLLLKMLPVKIIFILKLLELS